MTEHERLIQGESEGREEAVREAQEIASGDVAPMPNIDLDPAGGNHDTEEDD